MTWQTIWDWLLGPGLRILVIVVVAAIAQVVTNAVINRGIDRSIKARATQINRREVARDMHSGSGAAALLTERHAQRATAIGHLLKSIAIAVIWTIAITTVLETLHIDIGPILASAGIVGFAIGFGSQELIKDYFSGIALILEDQFGVGDVVEVNNVTGTVEEVTLRVTRLRDADGVVWYMRNGEIRRVANMSQGWTMSRVDIPVTPEADLEQVRQVFDAMGDELFADEVKGAEFVTAPRYDGVEKISADVVEVRLAARTEPGKEGSAGRTMREAAKTALDRAGIALATSEQIDSSQG